MPFLTRLSSLPSPPHTPRPTAMVLHRSRAVSTHSPSCSMMLPCVVVFILWNVTPVVDGYVIPRTDTASIDNSSSTLSDPALESGDSPHGVTFPLLQLAVLGPILALTFVLIWCLCRKPFRSSRLFGNSNRVTRSPNSSICSLRRERNPFRSSWTSSTSTEMTAVEPTTPISMLKGGPDEGLVKGDKTLGDCGDGQIPLGVNLPSVPPQCRTRS
ncbi:hypothetical protein NP233_g852 [Leucocoprinus birnbaumii]|uniref:Uncharacterized protein n=1 Tax=Leucocoprinus birnbaumii TaxID=56174 RepID=A0AAD5W133_9AGAR|nr:hypothetical protein NP233_g852 [Leucocoprinus birnbaumii]